MTTASDLMLAHFECSADSQEQLELEVRWMSSGETACCLRTPSKFHIAEIKAQVREHAGIPAEEQRIFWSNGRELTGDVDLTMASEHPTKPNGDHVQVSENTTIATTALLLVRSVSDPRITNLGSFRPVQTFSPLPSGGFSKVRKLSAGINGDIFLYRWNHDSSQDSVAVKMLQNARLARIWGTETDERAIHTDLGRKCPPAEDSLTEIGILSHLSNQVDLPKSLLRMLGVFAEGNFTWLVTEYCESGELFEVAASGAIAEPQLCLYAMDLLQAVAYLHRHHIGHRDISLENILLKGGQIKLMDFGMAVRSHSASGTPLRYFRSVGKDFYRAPECYVPTVMETSVSVPDGAKGGDVILAKTTLERDRFWCEVRLPPHMGPDEKTCKAEVWGYTTAPADIWAVAICIFILGFQCPPWNWAMLDDASFAYVTHVEESCNESGLEAVLKNWGKKFLSDEAMRLLRDMLKPDPALRPCATECLQSTFFQNKAASDAVGEPHGSESLAGGCGKVGGA